MPGGAGAEAFRYHRAMRKLVVLLLVLALGVGVAFFAAGRLPPPTIAIQQPGGFVGASTPFEVVVESPAGLPSAVRVVFRQGDRETVLTSAGRADGSMPAPDGAEDGPTSVHFTGTIDRQAVPDLQPGPAQIAVTAARPVLFGLRENVSEVIHDVEVRLEPPRVSVLSTHHYINVGGSEVVVYRVSPEDVESGVRVGDIEYPGFPASGAVAEDVRIGDPSLRVAFFALLYDQDPDTPIELFARDPAGNTARAPVDHQTFPKPVRQSRIELTDSFLERVVPAILADAPQGEVGEGTLERFLFINGEMRRQNAATIASFAAETSPEMLWRGQVFHPFTNSSVESAFADRRTYYYDGREVDRQVHLGFDLASYAGTPILAANRGTVLFADELGIYGQCVILDHGMGVQSLYAHLSVIDVTPGDVVEKEQSLGRSGMTGLAGGDHLHFTMLVNGQMVNPLEWWDAHWIEDRILRKLRAVSGS